MALPPAPSAANGSQEIEELAGKLFALIAYGTNSPRKANWGYEVHALNEADYPSFGLDGRHRHRQATPDGIARQ